MRYERVKPQAGLTAGQSILCSNRIRRAERNTSCVGLFFPRHALLLKTLHAFETPAGHHAFILRRVEKVVLHVIRRSLPRPKASLCVSKTRSTFGFIESKVRVNLQGVVNIWSPVNTAFAPAMKHIACSFSLSPCRPAASRMIVVGRTTLAVAIVRRST